MIQGDVEGASGSRDVRDDHVVGTGDEDLAGPVSTQSARATPEAKPTEQR
ncbi:hypothetical protein [Streptomyces europaeiscabiei]